MGKCLDAPKSTEDAGVPWSLCITVLHPHEQGVVCPAPAPEDAICLDISEMMDDIFNTATEKGLTPEAFS